MIFFTIAEVFNKLFGLLLVSIIARVLSVDSFAEFSLILVVFGYFLELAFYSYQNKNLIEYNKDREHYFCSVNFANRQVVIVIFSVFSAAVFSLLSICFFVNALPLALVLLLPVLSVDYVLYGNGKSSYVIISRFISQMFFLVILYFAVTENVVNENTVMYFYCLNSILLTLFVLLFTERFGYLRHFNLMRNVRLNRSSFSAIRRETKNQLPVFLSKVIVLLIPTMEQPLLLINSDVNNDIAISHRIALILLPFIIFYLNSNSDKLSEADLSSKILLSSLFTCVAVIFTPVIVRAMFGVEYIASAQDYALFFFIVPFQSFLNYIFLFGLKQGLERKLFKNMYVCCVIYIIVFIFFDLNFELATEELVIVVFIKALLFLFFNGVTTLKTNIKIFLAVCAPLLLAVLTRNYSVLNGLNNSLIDFINFCEKYKWI